MASLAKPRPNLLQAKITPEAIELSGVPLEQEVQVTPELYAELYGLGQAAGAVCDGFRDKLAAECEKGKTAKLVFAELEVTFTVQSETSSAGILLLKIDTKSAKRVVSCTAKPKIVVV